MSEEMIKEWKNNLRNNTTEKLVDMVKSNVEYAKKYLDEIAYYSGSSNGAVHSYTESLGSTILTIKVLNELIAERN